MGSKYLFKKSKTSLGVNSLYTVTELLPTHSESVSSIFLLVTWALVYLHSDTTLFNNQNASSLWSQSRRIFLSMY